MTDLVTTGTFDRVEQCLRSDRRLSLLAELLYELSLGMRAVYPDAGTEEYRAAAELICYNELLQSLAASLRASVSGRDPGYPDAALLAVLTGDAEVWGCDRQFDRALARAITKVDGTSLDAASTSALGIHERMLAELASLNRLLFITELAAAITAEAQEHERRPDASRRAFVALIEYTTLQRLAIDFLRTALEPQSAPASRSFIDLTIDVSPEQRGNALMRAALERALRTVEAHR